MTLALQNESAEGAGAVGFAVDVGAGAAETEGAALVEGIGAALAEAAAGEAVGAGVSPLDEDGVHAARASKRKKRFILEA